MGGHIFISHASADDDFVKALRIWLEESGLSVWVDSRNLRGGDKLSLEIQNAIDQARYVIVVLSPNTINSPWVRREIEQATLVESRDDVEILRRLTGALIEVGLAEYIGEPYFYLKLDPGGEKFYGTSPAVAYAVGTIALIVMQQLRVGVIATH